MTLYEQIGKERLKNIIYQFYDLVFINPKIGTLFKGEKVLIREKQIQFLTQFLGGPQLYTEAHGHPKMRARHLLHAITEEAKEEWLKCMKEAIYTEINDDDELANALYLCFPQVANHMVNR